MLGFTRILSIYLAANAGNILAEAFLITAVMSLGLAVGLTTGGYLVVVIGGLVTLIILSFAINTPGLNLFLLYLFTFLEGLGLSRIVNPNIKPVIFTTIILVGKLFGIACPPG